MKRFSALLLVLVLSFFTPAAVARQSHSLYGDLKVKEDKGAGFSPLSYTLVLYTLQGRGLVFARTTVTAPGRYRFFAVPNGEYELSVESEGQEVARIPILLQEKVSTDIRKDIELEVKPDPTAAAGASVSGLGIYARKPEAAAELTKAQQAVSAKDFPAAAGLLRKIVAADAADYEAWTELGTVLFRQQSLEEAGKAFQQALKAKPDFVLALVNLGKLQIARKNNEAAIETLSKAILLQPKMAEARFCLGEAYLQVKMGSKAVVQLNEALKLDPGGMADAHLRLGALYHAAGYRDRAASEYEQYLQKRPGSADREKLLKYIRDNKKTGTE